MMNHQCVRRVVGSVSICMNPTFSNVIVCRAIHITQTSASVVYFVSVHYASKE